MCELGSMISARFSPVTNTHVEKPSSWNDYISMVMLDSGFVSKGAIYGTEGRKWASSEGFDLSIEEVKNFVRGFIDPTKLWNDGIRLNDKAFTCTRAESSLIIGRECAQGTGCVLFKCNKCVLIAVHEEGAHPGGCHNVIVKLGDYLKDQGI